MGSVVGIDVGGTFTDCVVVDDEGRVWMDKAFTTPSNLAEGIVAALANVCDRLGCDVDSVLAEASVFALGTTSLINRVVSRRGARVGFITTQGHEDAVRIGRVLSRSEGLPEQSHYDVAAWNKPGPLFVEGGVRGVSERVDSSGAVVAPLDEAGLLQAVGELRDLGMDSIAVMFLWSFLNPQHELRARELIEQAAPGLPVNLSSDIAPTLGEFERANTTLMNAYLAPGADRDFAEIDARLRERGLRQPLLLMQSNGGLAASEELRRRPVTGLAAGPVGGVMGVQRLAAVLGVENAICTDMGGTSFDVGLIVDGQPRFSGESVVERHRLRVPTVEVTSIGAGGGSIAAVDEFGELHVGPHSAGSTPGPVCYAAGGTEPTVTDANVVLGRISPGSFWSGRRKLDRDAALAAITERVARPLGMDPVRAALGIIDIVDARMADLLRTMTISTGYDPREFALFAYGGAGPVHVGAYARQLGVSRVYVPLYAPVQSAFGIATGEFRRHQTRAAPVREPYRTEAIREVCAGMEASIQADWQTAALDSDAAAYQRFVDIRFRHQVHEIRVPLSPGDTAESLVRRFFTSYEQAFGKGSAVVGSPTEIVTFHLVSTLPAAVHTLTRSPNAGSAAPVPSATRDVYFDDQPTPTPVFALGDLGPGARMEGPLVVESPNTTVVVHSGQAVDVDGYANLVITV